MRVQYDSYKESGVPWAGDIPSEWETYPFFALAKANQTKNSALKENNLLSLSYGRVIEKDINTKFGLLPESFETYQIVESGQIVFRLTDLQNDKVSLRSALVKDRGIITSAYLAVMFKKLVPAYADYLMRAYDKQMVFYELGGGVRQSAKYDDLKWMPIIVPPKDDQKAIADFLDEKTAQIDNLIEKKEKLLELLAEKRIALITQAVTKGLHPAAPMKPSGIEWLGDVPEGWEIKKVKHLVSYIGSGKTPRGGAEVYTDEGIMILRSQNVYDNGLRLSDVVYVPIELELSQINTRLKADDVLLNITGASIGRSAIVPRDLPDANVNQHVCIFRPRQKKILPSFLHTVFCSHVGKDQVISNENGTSREGLNFQQAGNLKLALPPLEIQEEISESVKIETSYIDTVCATVFSAISKLKEYRSALITNAVTGKIKVT